MCTWLVYMHIPVQLLKTIEHGKKKQQCTTTGLTECTSESRDNVKW